MSFIPVVSGKRRPSLIDNLYSLGGGESGWIEGASNGSGSVSKNADHLFAEVSGNPLSTAERTWVTDSTFDLTDFGTIGIDWSASGAFQTAGLIISTSQTGDKTIFDERFHHDCDEVRRTQTFSFSLSGSYYIRVYCSDQSGTSDVPGSVEAYRVWLEE